MALRSEYAVYSLTRLSSIERTAHVNWCYYSLKLEDWGRLSNTWGEIISLHMFTEEADLAYRLAWF